LTGLGLNIESAAILAEESFGAKCTVIRFLFLIKQSSGFS